MASPRVIFLILASVCLSVTTGERRHMTLFHSAEKNLFFFEDLATNERPEDISPDWIVDMTFSNTIMENGWSTLELTTNPKRNESFQIFSAGYAEGYVTSGLIAQAWNNTIRGYCDGPEPSAFCDRLAKFINDNLQWMQDMIKKNPDDPYWQQVHLGLLQVQGLEDGYNNLGGYNPTIRLKPFGFLMFQMGGDLEDLETALNSTEHLRHHVLGSGSCSALIKLVNNNGYKDLLISQDTWNSYNSMLRIIKKYNFGSFSASFSSYPGYIFSGDDFYIFSNGMVAMETTNGNLNADLWKYVTPETVPEWLRTVVANRLSSNGKEWCEAFSRFNSGTYNNQWMILDYNRFNKGDETGLLYVLEQLPGLIEYSDVTDVLLKQTYWASYNVPYFPGIFNASGLPAMVKKYGDWFTHDKNPRAKIFARDHDSVTDIDSLRKLMRYNDFKHDPLSKCNCTPPYSAENAIAARSDLNPKDGVYPIPALGQRDHGATDVKMTSFSLHKSLAMVAEAGPTHDQQPVFEWDSSPFAHKPHEGHPNRFDFGPELITWGK